MSFILGRKVGMTQAFADDGRLVPVSIIEAGPCKVLSKREVEKNGYSAALVGFEEIEGSKIKRKSELGLFKKLATSCYKVIRECRDLDADVGTDLTVDQFKPGEKIVVTGFSKGKGWAGVIKLWNFSRGRESHGGKFSRHPGSIGNCTEPARVIKGRKMAGQWGNEKITLRSVEVVQALPEDGLLLVKGPLPGSREGLLSIRGLGEQKKAALKKSA